MEGQGPAKSPGLAEEGHVSRVGLCREHSSSPSSSSSRDRGASREKSLCGQLPPHLAEGRGENLRTLDSSPTPPCVCASHPGECEFYALREASHSLGKSSIATYFQSHFETRTCFYKRIWEVRTPSDPSAGHLHSIFTIVCFTYTTSFTNHASPEPGLSPYYVIRDHPRSPSVHLRLSFR